MMRHATPLTLLSLRHHWRRLLAAAMGLGFAVLLMLTELGFMTAINDSATLWVAAMDADLVVVSHLKDDFNPGKPFARQRLERLRGSDGVAAITPLYVSRLGNWRSQGRVEADLIRIVAFDPAEAAFAVPGIEQQRHLLQRPDTALVDRRLRDSYGGLRRGIDGELNGRRVSVIGDFAVGPDLQLNATLVVSDGTFRRCFATADGSDPLRWADFGLVKAAAGQPIEPLRRRLQERLEGDLDVLTPAALERRVHGFWLRNQPVGAVFGIGMVVGFCIGMMICYQILYTDIIDQLPQLATLKAMGYGDGYLVRMTLARSFYFALAALAVGLPASAWAFAYLQDLTGLTFTLTLGRGLLVAALTLLMCALAARLAMGRALAADPAELF